MKEVFIVFEENETERIIQGVFENEDKANSLCDRMSGECSYLNYYVERHQVM